MSHKSVLGYLKKKGQTNTFRLATDLGVDRHKLLDIIKKLEGKKLIEFRHGIVKFLKYPEKININKNSERTKNTKFVINLFTEFIIKFKILLISAEEDSIAVGSAKVDNWFCKAIKES